MSKMRGGNRDRLAPGPPFNSMTHIEIILSEPADRSYTFFKVEVDGDEHGSGIGNSPQNITDGADAFETSRYPPPEFRAFRT